MRGAQAQASASSRASSLIPSQSRTSVSTTARGVSAVGDEVKSTTITKPRPATRTESTAKAISTKPTEEGVIPCAGTSVAVATPGSDQRDDGTMVKGNDIPSPPPSPPIDPGTHRRKKRSGGGGVSQKKTNPPKKPNTSALPNLAEGSTSQPMHVLLKGHLLALVPVSAPQRRQPSLLFFSSLSPSCYCLSLWAFPI
ncbi:hypothetical protein B0H63DRAFT_213036 [Podospora didyma]|uniref:Uncharacterized protein n=1 Tax=Podospora didyma TaxID=330526 RepID=A0AAE0NHN4_9PEZI|nr:hypothetical protein B0H63DRAFT_213036 [Podospora didyma]